MRESAHDSGSNPVWSSLVRPIDNPYANFERLRGRWTDGDADKIRRRQSNFEAEQARKHRELRRLQAEADAKANENP